MSEVKLYVPEPPKELFAQQQEAPTLREKSVVHLLEKMEMVQYQGYLRYFKGEVLPMKGFPTPQAIHELNKLKKMLLEILKNINPIILLGLVFVNKNKLVQSFNDVFDKTFVTYGVRYHLIVPEYLCKAAYSFYTFTHRFVVDLGVEDTLAKKFALNLAQFVEYDDAYRYYIQDGVTAVNINDLVEYPQKTLRFMVSLWVERLGEKYRVALKMDKIVKPFVYLLYVPKFKKAFTNNAHLLEGMRFDEADIAWTNRRSDYMFRGIPFEERNKNSTQLVSYEVES